MSFSNRALRIVTVSVLAGCSAACATVTRGTNTAWQVKTTPPGAQVATSHGMSCPSTPCAIKMPRKSEFTATITKAGFKPASVHITHRLSAGGGAGMVGNALVGGVIGAGVDVASGAMLDLTPNPTVVVLEQDTTAALAIAAVPYVGPTVPAVDAQAARAAVAFEAPRPAALGAVVTPTVALRAAEAPPIAIVSAAPHVARPAPVPAVASPIAATEPVGGVRVRTQRVATPTGGIATIETFEPVSADPDK